MYIGAYVYAYHTSTNYFTLTFSLMKQCASIQARPPYLQCLDFRLVKANSAAAIFINAAPQHKRQTTIKAYSLMLLVEFNWNYNSGCYVLTLVTCMRKKKNFLRNPCQQSKRLIILFPVIFFLWTATTLKWNRNILCPTQNRITE